MSYVYIYYIHGYSDICRVFKCRGHENMSPWTDSTVNANYERNALLGGALCRTKDLSKSETPFATYSDD